MYKIRIGLFCSEKAAKKGITFINFPEQSSAAFLIKEGIDLKSFAKSIDASPSDLVKLQPEEVSAVHSFLKKKASTESKPKIEAVMADFKVQFKAPKIDLSSDDTVENSIRALRAANNMKLMSEQQLIYSSLIESDCMHLFAVLTTEQKTTVAAFCNYLLQAYGSAVNHYSRFERIKQEPTENFNNFLARIQCSYAALTGKSIVNFDENDKKIVVSKFVEAVCDNTVSAELTKVFSSLAIDTVAARAKNISTAMKKTPVMQLIDMIGGTINIAALAMIGSVVVVEDVTIETAALAGIDDAVAAETEKRFPGAATVASDVVCKDIMLKNVKHHGKRLGIFAAN